MRYSNRTVLYDGLYAYQTPEYSSWWNMRNRCQKSYKEACYYADQGIQVCKRWSDGEAFLNFFRDMGKKPSKQHTLDRIDPAKDYEPSNCRWATKSEQALNQRLKKSNNSGYRGVSWYKATNKWRVGVGRITVGYYFDKEEAALAYDCAAIQLYGSEAKLNILEQEHAN